MSCHAFGWPRLSPCTHVGKGLQGGWHRAQHTMRFGSTAKVLAECKLKYYRISECNRAHLCDTEAVLASQPEGNAVSNDGGVAMGDVGEGAGMHQDGGLLQRLHEGRRQGVLHENHEGTADAEVIGCDLLT